ncbi:unnamed protein product [Miscanthus lutarioriparius]|uniref:Exostosin GT47 domain-containing protein n=1 Tax=Miscanthus lutarioriparius TaxID=422564 RepID=A0A811NYS6_9POAL|nr:unnamed protein product [Miscanthus lutarioriparius]
MKRYECLTNRSAAASAVFIPFYAGFDKATRDAASADLSFWLTVQPQWRRIAGRDHFLVAGRTAWDFQRSSGDDVNADRGSGLLVTPVGRNMSLLVLESTLKHGSDFSVPYPTYFHPRSDADVLRWQDRVRGQKRMWLMAFVGVPRPDVATSIQVQDRVIAQCKAS